MPMTPLSESLLEKLKTSWASVLWGVLMVALALNLGYLLWPTSSQTLVIRPHPATFQRHETQPPVLIQATPAHEPEYLLVEPETDSKKDAVSHVRSYRPGHPTATPKAKAALTSPIHLNTATLAQLQQLPGIGPTMAQRILAYRKAHNGFQSVDQLTEVSGIGPKKLAKLKPFCTL